MDFSVPGKLRRGPRPNCSLGEVDFSPKIQQGPSVGEGGLVANRGEERSCAPPAEGGGSTLIPESQIGLSRKSPGGFQRFSCRDGGLFDGSKGVGYPNEVLDGRLALDWNPLLYSKVIHMILGLQQGPQGKLQKI